MSRPTPGERPLRSMAVLLLAAVIPACGGGDGGPPAEGQPAPDYSAVTLDGSEVRLSDLEGRPVLLNFWATWCTPCREETPFLQSLHERYRDRGLQVVGVSMDARGSTGDIRAFVERYGVTYRILHDATGSGMDVFSVMGLPATYVLDGDGTIRFVRIGPVSETDDAFLGTLDELVSSASGERSG